MKNNIAWALALIPILWGCINIADEPSVQKPGGLFYINRDLIASPDIGTESYPPLITGTSPITFAITKIKNADTSVLLDPDGVSIDLNTGAITVTDKNGLELGDYDIDVSASNIAGTTNFEKAIRLHIYGPPKNLIYPRQPIILTSSQSYVSESPSIEGSGSFIFKITNIDELGDFISLDSTTGVFSIYGNKSTVGEFNIKIEASNKVGKTSTDVSLIVSDFVGQWSFKSATLIDGDLSNDASTNLEIINGLTVVTGGSTIGNLIIPSAETPYTSIFVHAILQGMAPCTSIDPSTYLYTIDFKSEGILAFTCTSENTSEEVGSWEIIDDTQLILDITNSYIGYFSLNINDFNLTESTLTGKVEAFPMIKDASAPLGIDNIQFISFDIVLEKQ